MVEQRPSKPHVTGSNPVTRSFLSGLALLSRELTVVLAPVFFSMTVWTQHFKIGRRVVTSVSILVMHNKDRGCRAVTASLAFSWPFFKNMLPVFGGRCNIAAHRKSVTSGRTKPAASYPRRRSFERLTAVFAYERDVAASAHSFSVTVSTAILGCCRVVVTHTKLCTALRACFSDGFALEVTRKTCPRTTPESLCSAVLNLCGVTAYQA